MAPGRVIRVTRDPTPAPTAPSANVPIKNLNNTAGPERVTFLIIPSAGVQDSGGDAFALEPGVVDVFLQFEADFLHDVDFDFVAPSDAPGAAVLGRVLGAGCASAGASAVDGVLFHGRPGLGLVLVADVKL